MNEMTEAISEIKAKVSTEQWQNRIRECQQSGMSVRAWCMKNGITTGAYYFHNAYRIQKKLPSFFI